jgi:hypothetical protein
MGPMMRAVVGDTIEVTLRNNLDFPINIIPEGVTYTAKQGDAVAAPGQTIKYSWAVPELVRLFSSIMTSICTLLLAAEVTSQAPHSLLGRCILSR